MLAVHAYFIPRWRVGAERTRQVQVFDEASPIYHREKLVNSNSGKSPTVQHQIRCRPSIHAIQRAVSKTRDFPELPLKSFCAGGLSFADVDCSTNL
jgi:hypothetical protein